ncbi:hypothetical protein [uncultured Allomuricauda sp.]|uniref:hypothetical protein n=1 Tax=Flagellimonas sp. W118 TaxID=3410791 RepID=UPI002631205C|nr:hypothetical protein [uncultured Allomuricauda sp.]
MPFQKKSDFNFPLDGIKSFILARGLEEFTSALEKVFFAKASVQCRYNTKQFRADLYVELRCNYGLTEGLHYCNTGNWGGFAQNDSGETALTPFDSSYQNLYDLNKGAIDIAEISLHFNDTSLIVTRIYAQSIPEQLGAIIFKVSENFVYLTKGLTEMPYEIFVPVFEDVPEPSTEKENVDLNYYHHWGLYFDDEVNHNAMVYDLKRKKLYNEDFFLLE